MSWIIRLTVPARKQLAAIKDTRIRQNISKRISRLEDDPEKQGKPLSEELADYCSIPYTLFSGLGQAQPLCIVASVWSSPTELIHVPVFIRPVLRAQVSFENLARAALG